MYQHAMRSFQNISSGILRRRKIIRDTSFRQLFPQMADRAYMLERRIGPRSSTYRMMKAGRTLARC